MKIGRLLVTVPVGVLALLSVGCDGSSGAKNDGGTGGSSGECTKLWTVQRMNAGATINTAVVMGGALVLKSSNNQSGDLLSVTQAPLIEDFDLTFDFEAFVSGGEGAFVQAVVGEPALAPRRPIISAGISAAAVSAAFQPGEASIQPTTAKAGTFHFQRTGTAVTVTATPASGTAATETVAEYGTLDLQVGLQIGNNSTAAIAGETSVKITAFKLTGGGDLGIASDTFDCNSLK